MGLIDDAMADDLRYAFTDADSMPGVEAVVYKPKGGTPRTVNAQVFRDPPSDVEDARDFGSGAVRVVIARDATRGTLTVDMGGDQVNLAPRVGGTATDHHIVEIVTQDPAAWTLRLRGKAR